MLWLSNHYLNLQYSAKTKKISFYCFFKGKLHSRRVKCNKLDILRSRCFWRIQGNFSIYSLLITIIFRNLKFWKSYFSMINWWVPNLTL
jgi:hypothetical protein